MQRYIGKQEHGLPEAFVYNLVRRLRNQVLWDSLLTFCPPLLAGIYLVAVLYRESWIPALPLFVLASTMIVISSLAVIFRFRPRVPSVPAAARLVDTKAEAQDRFITLATVESSPSSEAMLARLRREAIGMLGRVELRRDFPYRLKRPFYWSILSSLVVILLFHLLVNNAFTKPGASPQQRIRDLAEQMTQRPGLAEIGHSLLSLADKLDDLKVTTDEKQTLIDEMQEQIQQQERKQEQDNQDLLSDASSTLKSLEQETGGEAQQKQQNAGGGVQSNASQGQGDGEASQGGAADSKGELSAQLNPETKDGKSAQGNPQGKGQEKNSGDQKEQKANQPDPGNSEKTTEDSADKMKQNSEGRSGKNRSDEIPKDGPPAERYRQPGEQAPDGIKGAKYVTVQLPEEIAGDSSGVTTSSKDGKESKHRPKVPVSNVPLPAQVPEAPAEKQRMPLEYRDVIR